LTAPEKRTTASSNEGHSLFGGVARHSLIYGLGAILVRGVSFLMLPVYTRYLTPADYGVMALIQMTLDFIAIVGGGTLALGVFRFHHKADNEEDRRQIVATAFLLIGTLYSMIGVGVYLAAVPLSVALFESDVHADLIQVAAGGLALSSLTIVPLALARVKDLSGLFVRANAGQFLVGLTLNIVFIVGLGLGVMGVFLSSLIANGVVGSAMTIWLLRDSGARVSLSWARKLLRYGLPLMASQVATFFATFSDRYFLQGSGGEAVVGLYNLAYQFGFLLVMVGVTPMFMVWGPKRFMVARQENRDEVLAHGFLLMNVLLFTTAVGISLYVTDALRIMSTSAFHPAARVVPLILIAYIFQSWANAQDIGILVREKTKYLAAANWVSAVVAVLGYAFLIPRYLEWGAAVATTLAFGTRFVLTYVFSQYLWPVRYRWAPIWVLVAWSATVAGVGLVLPPMSVVVSLSVRTLLVGVFGVGLWSLPILADKDRAAARKIVSAGLARARQRH
jgi:O-antigen/teichoic acid export membrane protein